MNKKEQKRLMVLSQIDRGELGIADAADLLGVSERQVKRVRAACRQKGVAALAHGNRGRVPANVIGADVRSRVVTLAQTTYQGINHQHLADLLSECEGIALSRASVQRILGEVGMRSPRTRRGRKHRSRRDRYPQVGMLVQVDGSRHHWLGDELPWLCLLAAIDDATGAVHAALFRQTEDAHGYMLLLEQMVRSHGRPLAVYHDRHTIFAAPKDEERTISDELAGRYVPAHVERVLQDLAITSIAAHSPQAKGRVERLFGTLQDRLTSELRLAGVATMEEANAFLPAFLTRFNRKFCVPADQEGSAYRRLDPGMRLDRILGFKYLRTVGADNVVRFATSRLQVGPCHGRMSYARLEVEVHERLDGSYAVYHQGRCLAATTAPAEAPVLRARGGRSRPTRPVKEEVAAVVGDVGMLAASSDPQTARTDRGRQHIHVPLKPAADHPWRR